jgi:multiple sugar transport system permease protein
MITSSKRVGLWSRLALYLILILTALITTFPLYWVVLTSFKTSRAVYDWEQTLIPHTLTLENYALMFRDSHIIHWLEVTLLLAVVSVLVAMVIGICAAYSVTSFNYPGRESLSFLIWVAYVVPTILLLIPLFLTINALRLVDNFVGLALAYQAFLVPSATWLLMGYMRRMPRELKEAALIDGCTPIGVLLRILLPLAAPGIATAAIFTFTAVWNEFVLASTLVRSPDLMTMSLGLLTFMLSDTFLWGQMAGASVVALVPALFLFSFLQRYVVQGLTLGSVKG